MSKGIAHADVSEQVLRAINDVNLVGIHDSPNSGRWPFVTPIALAPTTTSG